MNLASFFFFAFFCEQPANSPFALAIIETFRSHVEPPLPLRCGYVIGPFSLSNPPLHVRPSIWFDSPSPRQAFHLAFSFNHSLFYLSSVLTWPSGQPFPLLVRKVLVAAFKESGLLLMAVFFPVPPWFVFLEPRDLPNRHPESQFRHFHHTFLDAPPATFCGHWTFYVELSPYVRHRDSQTE